VRVEEDDLLLALPLAVVVRILGLILSELEGTRDDLGGYLGSYGVIPSKLGRLSERVERIALTFDKVKSEVLGGYDRLDELKEGVVSAVADVVSSVMPWTSSASSASSSSSSSAAEVAEEGLEGGEETIEAEPITVTRWKAAEGYAPMLWDVYEKTTFSAAEFEAMPAEDQELLVPFSVKLSAPSPSSSPGRPLSSDETGFQYLPDRYKHF
jgi:hypothetical protein